MTLRLIDGKSPGIAQGTKRIDGKEPDYETCFSGSFRGWMRINRPEIVGGHSITFTGTDIRGDPLVEVEIARKSFEIPCPIGNMIEAHGVRIKTESMGTHILQAEIGLIPISETIIGSR
jgi:hypothetical protein